MHGQVRNNSLTVVGPNLNMNDNFSFQLSHNRSPCSPWKPERGQTKGHRVFEAENTNEMKRA